MSKALPLRDSQFELEVALVLSSKYTLVPKESLCQSFILVLNDNTSLDVLLNVMVCETVSPGFPVKNNLVGDTEMPCAVAVCESAGTRHKVVNSIVKVAF